MSHSPVTTPSRWEQPKRAALLIGGLVLAMYALELIDTVTFGFLDQFGIRSWQPSSLPMILVAPWLHFGWSHLLANTIPFAVLGFLIRVTTSFGRWLITTVITAVVSGLTAWLLSPLYTIVAGASGVIFGYLTYLLARGIFSRDIGQILVAVVVFIAYGSVLLGVLPTTAGVSWQAHLGGALGGVLAAWLLHKRQAPAPGAKVSAAPGR
ncbi:rhomboid family intramembrane serine protease [Enemella sp. A6]|uniref:rhomboid family intramembrane serine protease n=1 Tax=Enemella sp. A6 TaxID=3440152 RepID=UPI003EBA5961